MWRNHTRADLRVDVSRWPKGTDHISADHVETLSASVYCRCLKKVLPETIRNNFELIESFIFLFIPSSCNNCNLRYKSNLQFHVSLYRTNKMLHYLSPFSASKTFRRSEGFLLRQAKWASLGNGSTSFWATVHAIVSQALTSLLAMGLFSFLVLPS